MDSDKSPAFLATAGRIPSDRDLDRLREAIHREARRRDFSQRRIARYEAWILGFISWCVRTAPNSVPDQKLEAFRRALKEHPKTRDEHLREAMDALAFLYGAVNEADEILSFIPSLSNRKDPPYQEDETPNLHSSEITTLRLGWQEEVA